MSCETQDIEVFSGIEQPPLLEQIKRILDEYRNDVQIIKELIQNADDAEATSMKILYEGRTINAEQEDEAEYRKFLRAPALVFYNDAKFTDDDWRGIRSIYTSVKRDDPLKIGRFGLGFKSVFHLTDFPCIISGEYAMFIDPHASDFGKICVTVKLKHLKEWRRLNSEDYMNSLDTTFGFSEQTLSTGQYEGTMFWFPLRQTASPLSDNVYPEGKVVHLLQAFINESNRSLIFLKTLCSIQLFIDTQHTSAEESGSCDGHYLELKQMSLGKDEYCYTVEVNNKSNDLPLRRKAFLQELKDTSSEVPDQSNYWMFTITVQTVERSLVEDIKVAKSRWLIVNYLKGGEISEKTRQLMSDKELGYPHVVSLAAPLNKQGEYSSTAGHVFCYQPLPQENVCMTGLPVHVNGFFALSQNRRQVRWPDQGDPTYGEGDKKIEWNIALRSEILPEAYEKLIIEITSLCQQEQNQEYLLKAAYNTIPNIPIVDEHWSDLASKVITRCKDRTILYTEQDGGKWIMPQEAVFTIFERYPGCNTYQKTIHDLLFADKVNLVSVPQHVFDALETVCPSLVYTTPAFVKSHLEYHEAYKELSIEQKQDLLEFVCLDSSRRGLNILQILPLADGTFETFDQGRHVFLETQEVIDLFPGQEANFVYGDLRPRTRELLTDLMTEGAFCLQRLTDDSTVEMAKDILSENFIETNPIVCNSDVEKWKTWIRGIWNLIQTTFRKSVRKFSDVPIFPLASDSDWKHVLDFSLLKLMSPLFYIPSFAELDDQENISRSLQLLSVSLIKCIPEDLDIDLVRPFLHEETSESIAELLDRIDETQVERYNTDCSDEDSEAFLKFMSERIHTKVGSKGLWNLRHLKIFRSHKSVSESELVSLGIIDDIYEGSQFPVRFPKQMILLNSDTEKTFAKHLGTNFVSELELVRLTLKDIGEYNNDDKQRFAFWVITNGVHFSCHDVQESLKEIDFLEATDGTFHKVGGLFDPSIRELCNLFRDEHVFPKIDAETEQQYLIGLRTLGLKTTKELRSADIERVCCKVHDMASGKLEFDKTTCTALLEIMNENGRLVEKCRLYNKRCIFIEDTVVENFPQFIPLKNRNTTSVLLCMPSDIKSVKLIHLIGSVMYTIDCKKLQTLSKLFDWDTSPEVAKVVEHLFNVVQHYEPEHKSTCLPVITSIYNCLSETDTYDVDEVREVVQRRFTKPHDTFVWDGNAFQSVHNMYTEIAKGDVDMKPFLHPLPVEIKHLSAFFVQLGCRKSLEFDMYVNTLDQIKGSEHLTDDDEDILESFTDVAVAILNKIKKNFLQEFKESELKLYFPTMKENGGLQMMPADCCTYCDEQWLKNMDFQLDDDTHYVHPELPLATAEALGVPSLRQQMMSDTEAFEEWGQEEPLTRRLRNLLKEGYVDGFSVAKELFQNADDAGASKLWILFDERENNDAKAQLISEGMSECQGPAIWVYNDEKFSEADLKNITKLSGATKEDDSTKIGKFGLGFCAVYNITDVPSFVSGENFIIFDPDMSHLGKVLPGRSPGLRINFRVMKNLKMMKSLKNQFQPFEDVFGCKIVDNASPCFNGTLFRLPLRNKASDISDVVYSSSEVRDLFEKIMTMAANMLLFNQNVVEFKLFHLPKSDKNPSDVELLFEVNKMSVRLLPSIDLSVNILPVLVEATRRKQANSFLDNPLQVIDQISVNITNYVDSTFKVLAEKTENTVDWLVSWSSGSDEALRLTYEEKGALPLAAVAIPVNTRKTNNMTELEVVALNCVSEQFYSKGHLFFFLPLPIQHRFPFHINSQFTVTTDRRQLKTSTEDDKNVKMKKWNEYLLKDPVQNALLYLLENLHCLGKLEEYKYDSLWPRNETAELLEYLPSAFYQKVVKPELYNVFERDGQWFDISRCVLIDRKFRSSTVGNFAFEMLSQLTEFVVDVSEDIYALLYQANHHLIEEKTVTEKSFFLDYFLPNLEDFSSDKCTIEKRKQLLYHAVELQDVSIDMWLKSNECIPSQPYGNLKRPNELVDIGSNLSALFVASDGFFPECPFTERNILEKLRLLGLMHSVLDDTLVTDRASSVEQLNKKCSLCALERSGHVIRYLSENISKHNQIVSNVQDIKFIPVQAKPQDWHFEWHADIFSSSKASKKCKAHRKSNTENQPTYFDRACNVYFSDCKNIIGCNAFVFDKKSYFHSHYRVHQNSELKSMLKILGMNGITKEDVDVRFVLKQLEIIVASFVYASDSFHSSTVSTIVESIYGHLDKACESENILDYIARETTDKAFVFVTDTFILPKNVSRYLFADCKPYLYRLRESPLEKYATLCKCLSICDYFPPYHVAMVLQTIKHEKADMPLCQSEVHTVINVLLCLQKSIQKLLGEAFDVQSFVTDELQAIYGPDEHGILRDCKTMCFNDFDDMEKSESMIYADGTFPPDLAKFFGVKPKLIHSLEESSEDIEDFYQDEPLVTRLNRLVEGYPCDSGIFKELLQNADDAHATEIHFIKDYTIHPSYNIIDPRFEALQGPALVVYNNSAFSNDDLKGIQRLGRGSKADDPSQTGRYGVGFNAVYNLTDAPSFYTIGGDIENGETMCFFDPLANYLPNATRKRPGKRYKDVKTIRTRHSNMMNGYHDKVLIKGEPGTIFRFPLRTKAMAEKSEIKPEAVHIERLSSLLTDFLNELRNVMLFLKHLRTVKVSTCKDGKLDEDFHIDVTMSSTQSEERKKFVDQQRQMGKFFKDQREDIFKFEQYTSSYELSMNVSSRNTTQTTDFIVVQTLGFDKNKPVNHLIKEELISGHLGLLPHGGVALQLQTQISKSSENRMWAAGTHCKAFCFLPLPIETGLPVHVHGYFALDHETRRTLWRAEELETCYRSLWNQMIIEHVISASYVNLLKFARNVQFQGITNEISSQEMVISFLSNYQTLFPLKENMGDSYWKYLLCSVYRRLVTEYITFLPVQSMTTNVCSNLKTVQLTWTSLNIEGSSFPAYIKAEDSSNSTTSSQFNNILRRIGMRIVYVSDEIKEALDFSGVGISVLEPHHVIDFLCCQYNQDTSKRNECKIETGKHVEQTVLQSVGDTANILLFCLTDLNRLESNLKSIPLMITQDNIVREVPENGFFFVEKRNRFCHFFPSKLQRFVHSSIAVVLSTYIDGGNTTFQGKFKTFNLSHFVQLVQETNQIEHDCTSAKVWDKSNPPESWIRLFWDFFLYQLSHDREQNISQQLQLVEHLPLIPVARPLSNDLTILPACCMNSLLNLESFTTERLLHSALEKMNFPQISKAFFSKEFVSKGLEYLLKEVPNYEAPLKVLDCLYKNAGQIELSNIPVECLNAILWYFNNCLDNDSILDQDIAKFKEMPLFLSHFGQRVVLKQYSTLYIVPKDLPEDGLEDLAKKANVLFLRNTGQNVLFKLLNLDQLSLIQVYTRFIIPEQHLLESKCFYRHVTFLSFYIHTETKENTVLLELLRNTAFVETQNGVRVRVSNLFDSEHVVFKTMCQESELVPTCLRSASILNLFKKLGLTSEMTLQLFERFAKQIESRSKTERLSKRVKDESKLLTAHLLSMKTEFFRHEMFEELAKVKFVMPHIVDKSLSSIKEQFNSECLICFAGAVVNKSQTIAWTVSNILPIHADPSTHRKAELLIQMLEICIKPSLRTLVRHCENIGKSLENIMILPNRVCHKKLQNIMHEIYKSLNDLLDSEEFTEDCSHILANVPMVYYPDTKIIVLAKQVTIACKTDEEIPPYLMKCPESYLQYKKLFLGLGASEEPSCNSFAHVLHILMGEATDTKLNPKEYSDAIKAMGYLYKYLAEEKEKNMLSNDQLFLLSCEETLKHGKSLVVPNNQYLQKQLAKGTTSGCIYHIAFKDLEELHIKREDCIENLKYLPQKCRPYLLTDVVKDRVILENIKCEDRKEAESFKDFLRCNDFVYGFLRLIRHVLKAENTIWTENNEAAISQSLKSIECTHCSGIETKLALRCIENGCLGTEILVENTNERKFSHIEVNEEAVNVFFDSSDPNWRRNVTKLLTVHLNRLAGQCLKDEHILLLSDILGMYENPDDISLHLSREQIEEFTFELDTIDNRPCCPTPGTIVPQQYHEFLDNELIIYEYDFKFMALEVDDPAIDKLEEQEDENENNEENGENMEATYIFVHIIKRIGPENELPLLQEYEIDCGGDSSIKVKGSQLFKFVRKRKNANTDEKQVVIYERTNGEDNESPNHQRESMSLKEVLSEIRQYLREAWNKDEQEKRRIIKRLMLRWHPDKNPENVPFCTKVFQYIQQCLSRLEKGIELTDDDADDEENGANRNANSGSSGTYSSSSGSNRNSWYNRYWQRYTWGRQYNERRYEHYRSGQRSRRSGGRNNNFEDTWRARQTNAQSRYEPYHWYSRASLWYTQAQYDLRNARASLQLVSPQCNWICYNSHQAAEKALKAAWYAKDANKIDNNLLSSHNLELIASGVGSEAQTLAKRLSNLTGDHAKMTYPDPHFCKIPAESFSKHTAESVIEIAADILRVCSSYIKTG